MLSPRSSRFVTTSVERFWVLSRTYDALLLLTPQNRRTLTSTQTLKQKGAAARRASAHARRFVQAADTRRQTGDWSSKGSIQSPCCSVDDDCSYLWCARPAATHAQPAPESDAWKCARQAKGRGNITIDLYDERRHEDAAREGQRERRGRLPAQDDVDEGRGSAAVSRARAFASRYAHAHSSLHVWHSFLCFLPHAMPIPPTQPEVLLAPRSSTACWLACGRPREL